MTLIDPEVRTAPRPEYQLTQQERRFIGSPTFPSILIEAHVKVGQRMTLPETLEYMQMRLVQAEELAGEIVLRVLQSIGPELGQQLLTAANFAAWGVKIAPERLETETLIGQARRQKMSVIARDLERTMGPVPRHEAADRARDLLAMGATS